MPLPSRHGCLPALSSDLIPLHHPTGIGPCRSSRRVCTGPERSPMDVSPGGLDHGRHPCQRRECQRSCIEIKNRIIV
ncbi:hypothetical protein EUGRSUZ_H04180 [Eucalyptus grandis]|uniref:Uncharacterized protein n=2 Tax=Eucalyptus grandis TaxID=71139 RepID=A0ACC3JVD3_EUCGR|nr:hypothetical protein EUGRSUZ_H04180 [Eucalyptus grandis]